MSTPLLWTLLAILPIVPILWWYAFLIGLRAFGRSLAFTSQLTKDGIITRTRREQKAEQSSQVSSKRTDDGWEKIEKGGKTPNNKPADDQWEGIVGFLHPFCNAGGGGERVLWAAIAATQRRYPRAICAVYTGDHDIDRASIVPKIQNQFGISLQQSSLHFIYLSSRNWVVANEYPYFTLLFQSLGSLVMAFEAFNLLVPDIFIDTMGYAFTLALSKHLFSRVPNAAYVHYPTISTDMLESLDDTTGTKGMHSGAGVGYRGRVKKIYWHIFAWMYGWVGKQIDVVMCNSTWTQNHITKLWKKKSTSTTFASVIYPPCPVEEIESKTPLSEKGERRRQNILLYIAQFRPEKNHTLILNAFAKYFHSSTSTTSSATTTTTTTEDDPTKIPHLVLIGSVRHNTSADEKHVYNLRLLAHELKIDNHVTFKCDAPFSMIQEYLSTASISVNGMYSEHFGIGNVEGIAAGLIPVVHNSGGPKMDIVVPYQGKPIGFLAENEDEYAEAFEKIGGMKEKERFEMRKRARESARRFTEEVFARKWVEEMERLVQMRVDRTTGGGGGVKKR